MKLFGKQNLLCLILLMAIALNTCSTQFLVSSMIVENVKRQEITAAVASGVYSPTNPSLAIDSQDKLYLTYRENAGAYSRIAMLKTDANGDWNLTVNSLYVPAENNCINSQPAMIFYQENFYLGISMTNAGSSFLKLLEIDPSSLESSVLFELDSNETVYSKPRLSVSNQTFWFSWHNNNESNYNLYCTKYNYTSMSVSSIIQISNNTFGSCQNSELFLDEDGNCHFVWSQGLDYKNHIFYKCLAENDTCLMSSHVVPNTSFSVDPEIFVEKNDQVNIFWSNLTEVVPSMLGTKNIHYRTYTKENNWSTSERVAPYRPADRIEMMTDGENPEVIHDNLATLWMAYEIIEPYQYFSGIAIRGRENGVWLAGEPVTNSQSPAYDPCLVTDSVGHIHCVWVDFRFSYYEIYYKARFNIGLWSFEEKLTEYIQSAFVQDGPKMIGFYIGAIVLFGVLLPSTYFIVKRIRTKKLIAERRKLIMND